MAIDKAGECVDTSKEIINALGKDWKLKVEVYHNTGNEYNLYATIREANFGMFDVPDSWKEKSYGVKEEDFEQTIDMLTRKLIKKAEQRIEARDIEIEINIDEID